MSCIVRNLSGQGYAIEKYVLAPQENSILKGKKHKRLCEECTARRASSLKKKERKKETEKSGAHDVRAWLQLTTHHTKEPLNLMTCMHVLPGSEVRTPCPFGHGTQKGSCKYAVRKNRSIQDPDRVRRQSPNGSTITIPLQRGTVCRGKNKPFFDGVLQRPVAVGQGQGQGESEKGGGNSRLQAACSLPGHGQHHCRLSTNKRARWLVK